MSRPSNADIYGRETEVEEGAEKAVDAYRSAFQQVTKVIEAEVEEDGTFEVVGGWQDGNTGMTHILSAHLGADLAVLDFEERPDVPPGQAKKPNPRVEKLDKVKKDREPKAKKDKTEKPR